MQLTLVELATHDERPGVNETRLTGPAVLVTCTEAGSALSAGIANVVVTSTVVPAVGADGAAVMVAVMSPGVCALTGAVKSTRAAPRTPNAENTFFMNRTSHQLGCYVVCTCIFHCLSQCPPRQH